MNGYVLSEALWPNTVVVRPKFRYAVVTITSCLNLSGSQIHNEHSHVNYKSKNFKHKQIITICDEAIVGANSSRLVWIYYEIVSQMIHIWIWALYKLSLHHQSTGSCLICLCSLYQKWNVSIVECEYLTTFCFCCMLPDKLIRQIS